MLDIKEFIIFLQYTNYINVYLPGFAKKLLEHNSFNNYSIDLINNKELLYYSIYSFGPIRLMEHILKTYIVAKALPTTKRIELFNAKKFAVATLENNDKIFVIWFQKLRIFIFFVKHKLPC